MLPLQVLNALLKYLNYQLGLLNDDSNCICYLNDVTYSIILYMLYLYYFFKRSTFYIFLCNRYISDHSPPFIIIKLNYYIVFKKVAQLNLNKKKQIVTKEMLHKTLMKQNLFSKLKLNAYVFYYYCCFIEFKNQVIT